MGVHGGPDIVEDGLIFAVDAGNGQSYVSGSTTCTNLFGPYTGSLQDDTQYSPSVSGCWNFDGADDFINCGDMEMDGWTALTIEAWYKCLDSNNLRRIVSKDQVGVQGAFIFYKDQNADLAFTINDGGGWYSAAYTSYSEDNNWHHAMGVFNGSTTKLYFDGVEVASVASSISLDDADNEEVVIGADSDVSSPEQEWLGQIANVKIYNKGLSAAEVLQNYNATKGRFT